MVHPRRRTFLRATLGLMGLSLLAGCGVLPVPRQGRPSEPRIGFLAVGRREARENLIEAFLQGLRELGYEDGRSIRIEYRFSETIDARLSELAAELADLKVDLIVTIGTPATMAARDASNTLPIVAAAMAEPVASGLVASLARPGGNLTGLSTLANDTDMKRMEMVRDVVPAASRVGVLANPSNPVIGPRLNKFEAAARVLGQQVLLVPARTVDDFAGAFEAAVRWRADALLVPSDGGFTLGHRNRVVDLAAKSSLPTFYEHREFTDAGGLVSFGPNYTVMYRRSAAYVDRILKGAKPADLPIEQPTTFEFVINLKTAQSLGLTIPGPALRQATEIIH